MPETFNRQRAAVVLIDLQNDVVRPAGREPLETFLSAVHQSAKLVAWAREHTVPVVYVAVNRRPDGTDWPRRPLGRSSDGPPVLIEGTAGSDIVDELTPLESDYIVIKRRTSAFHGTSFDLLIRRLEKDIIIIGGIATNWGVESTVRNAWDRDYDVIVAADCCAAFSPDDHQHSLDRVFSRRGPVLTVDEIAASFGT